MHTLFKELFEQKYPNFTIEDSHIVCKDTRLSMKMLDAFELMVLHDYSFDKILVDLQVKMW